MDIGSILCGMIAGLDQYIDVEKGIKLLHLVEHSQVDALLSLGIVYANGIGVDQDIEKAISYFKAAADLGNVDAMTYLGALYCRPDSDEFEMKRGLDYYRQAVEKNSIDAMAHLGMAYATLESIRDYREALKNLNHAAAFNHPAALYYLGLLFREGRGVPRDLKKANEYLARAIEAGHPGAKAELGCSMLFDSFSQERPKNVEKGISLLEEAAKENVPLALLGLGVVHATPLFDHHNYKLSYQYLEKAWDAGSTHAGFLLGQLYQHSNPDLSMDWFRRAADRGHVEASKALTLFEKNGNDDIKVIGEMFQKDIFIAEDAPIFESSSHATFVSITNPVDSFSVAMSNSQRKSVAWDIENTEMIFIAIEVCDSEAQSFVAEFYFDRTVWINEERNDFIFKLSASDPGNVNVGVWVNPGTGSEKGLYWLRLSGEKVTEPKLKVLKSGMGKNLQLPATLSQIQPPQLEAEPRSETKASISAEEEPSPVPTIPDKDLMHEEEVIPSFKPAMPVPPLVVDPLVLAMPAYATSKSPENEESPDLPEELPLMPPTPTVSFNPPTPEPEQISSKPMVPAPTMVPGLEVEKGPSKQPCYMGPLEVTLGALTLILLKWLLFG